MIRGFWRLLSVAGIEWGWGVGGAKVGFGGR